MKGLTYRIVTNHGTVDFAVDIETAERKFSRYKNDMESGYSKYVSLVSVDPDTGAETVVRTSKHTAENM